MKNTLSLITILMSLVLLSSLAVADVPDTSSTVGIRVQNLNMQLAPDKQKFSEALLPGEIADVEVNHVILSGPLSQSESLSKEHDTILLF
ncbi:hypothetical protein ACFLS9_06385, partial [Bacteroidota bacterium]